MKEMVLNNDMQTAWEFIEHTDMSVFLTGKAGTGKTTFLKYVVEHTSKTCVVTAPTGVAAINAGGVTLHSFLQLPFSPYVPGTMIQSNFRFSKQKLQIIRALDLLIIDEISMVRADLLDCVDAMLRRLRKDPRPFGGVQLLLIGDLQQLPPVVTPADQAVLQNAYSTYYFFSSRALERIQYVTMGLKQIYRQQNPEFLKLLNHVRSNTLSPQDLLTLKSLYNPRFNPGMEQGYIRLTTHNAQADSYNASQLEALPGKPFSFSAKVKGVFPESSFPTDMELVLKEGAQVMFLKNDTSADHLFYNGKIATVISLNPRSVRVRCLDDDVEIDVKPMEWENARYEVDNDTNIVEAKVEGVFSQLPLRLAWAITVHKSQGLTFNRAIIDAGRAFAPGQVYVALSRCRSMEGVVLTTPLNKSLMMSDPEVLEFISGKMKELEKCKEALRQSGNNYRRTLLAEMFDFRAIGEALHNLRNLAGQRMGKGGAAVASILDDTLGDMQKSITDVAVKWRLMLERMTDEQILSQPVQDKIHNGIAYFLERLKADVTEPLLPLAQVKSGNKMVAQRWNELFGDYSYAAAMKQLILSEMLDKPFSTELYLAARRKGALEAASPKKGKLMNLRLKKRQKTTKNPSQK